MSIAPGSVVTCRYREWIVLPTEDPDVLHLRPLLGTIEDKICLHRGLMEALQQELPWEQVVPAVFPLPLSSSPGPRDPVLLFFQAARLLLRDGTAPLRCLGNLNFRPRQYQLVPLLMALRLHPVRLLIADDVGIGKTIEALLIARELLDRGEIRRFAVLCPPALCEQWAYELEDKFHLSPVIIRSGTIACLEREVPPGNTPYQYFPVQVISLDFIKSERHRRRFLEAAPDLVIVDEAHGAAMPPGGGPQEWHQLLTELVETFAPDVHLLLLTATPHSGHEETFRSLLGLLDPVFGGWDTRHLTNSQCDHLARHFVQRTRQDIVEHWDGQHCFPVRETVDETYHLGAAGRELFEKTYRFCTELIRSGEHLTERRRRVHHWVALSLLRCVMSSPAAALAAFSRRRTAATAGEEAAVPASGFARGNEEFDVETLQRGVLEFADGPPDDESPTPFYGSWEACLSDQENMDLAALCQLAERLYHPGEDTKLTRLVQILHQLLQEGLYPVIWCRYVATAEYLYQHLGTYFKSQVMVSIITGRMGHDEREVRVHAIPADCPRILVATDCLSEGINLQEKFTAVIHYDLPWNPNRLEQREGRVDRYGQSASRVRAVRFFATNNPVDGVALEVLLRKADEIHRTLGVRVPVPGESETVARAVLQALFMRPPTVRQLTLDLVDNPVSVPEVSGWHKQWMQQAQREQVHRTRFAQRTLNPAEVLRELEVTDQVLGSPSEVADFCRRALFRLGISCFSSALPGVWEIKLPSTVRATLPEPLRWLFPDTRQERWLVAFDTPAPPEATVLGRHHPLIRGLAQYLFETAIEVSRIEPGAEGVSVGEMPASRTGVLCTTAVMSPTVLFLLRVRYLATMLKTPTRLLEEVLLVGLEYSPEGTTFQWLSPTAAGACLLNATPAANLSPAQVHQAVALVAPFLSAWSVGPDIWKQSSPFCTRLATHLQERARELTTMHRHVRRAARLPIRTLTITPHLPPDWLGWLVLLPCSSSSTGTSMISGEQP